MSTPSNLITSQLDAGGLVPITGDFDAKTMEQMVARTYHAAILGDRPVITIRSARLGPAEDLAMEFLGFTATSVSEPVAMQLRSALDFAHWALIHRPDHARFALDLVKQMKSAARKAASKPGGAWDLFTAMADQLNQSVRDFLPPFWEQVGRIYKDLGNQTYAGRGLNKALEAERVHALPVDRDRRRDAILEFALSGCLSGKALSEYAKDLEKQYPAAEAYETFRDLTIRRTLGGMAPIGGAATDLTRLAKAAGLDVNSELESFLLAIIGSPAMSRAPLQFWKSVKAVVKRLVAQNDPFAAWLLVHTNPQSSYRADSPVWQWLDLLDDWGVLPLIADTDRWPADVELPGGRAAWLSRIITVESSPPKRAFELLEQMAEVLRQEAQPLSLQIGQYGHSVEVDLLDACLDLRVPVAVPERFTFDFDGWLRAEIDHPRRNSQLTHVAAVTEFSAAMQEAIPELSKFAGEDKQGHSWGRTVAPRRSFDEAAHNHPAVRQSWCDFLTEQVCRLEQGGLVDVENANGTLREAFRSGAAEQFPELLQRLQKVDLTAALQRTLAAGVFDEYGWEAFDQLADQHPLPTSSRRQNGIFPVFPHLIVYQDNRVRVIDAASATADQPTTSREIALTKDQSPQQMIPLGDDIAVLLRDTGDGWKTSLRWLSDWDRDIQPVEWSYSYDSLAVLPLSGGQYFCGERGWQPGDTRWSVGSRWWFSDGQRFWALKPGLGQWEVQQAEFRGNALCEIDPITGKSLRDSVPPLFEENLPAGSRLQLQSCYLYPLPPQSQVTHAGESPLGSRDGQIGWRVVRRRDGAHEGVGIDGRRWLFDSLADQRHERSPLGMIDQPAAPPGDQSYWIIADGDVLVDARSGIQIGYCGGDHHLKYLSGQPAPLPLCFLHLMRVRSLESSQRLRKVTLKQAAALLEAGAAEHAALKLKEDPDRPDPQRNAASAAVSKLLPKAPPRLVKGVARIARIAAEESLVLAKILERLVDQPATASSSTFDKQRADAGFVTLLTEQVHAPSVYYCHDQNCCAESMLAAGDFLHSSAPQETELPLGDLLWMPLLARLPASVWWQFWRTAIDESAGQSVAERLKAPWLESLRCLLQSRLLELPGTLTLYQAERDSDEDDDDDDDNAPKQSGSLAERLTINRPLAFVENDQRYIAFLMDSYLAKPLFVLGYTTSGKPKPPSGLQVDDTHPLPLEWNHTSLKAFLQSVEKVNALPLPSAETLAKAAETLSLHPIAVALVWMGNLRTNRYGQEKLSKELRDHYGWKLNEIKTAIAELDALELPSGLLSIVPTKMPSGALGDGQMKAFELLVKTWQSGRKRVIALPADVMSTANSDLLVSPQDCDLLKPRIAKIIPTPRKRNSYDDPLSIEYTPSMPRGWDDDFAGLRKLFTMVNYELPVAAEARLAIPAALDAVRQFLDLPTTALEFGGEFTSDPSVENKQPPVGIAQLPLGALVGRVNQDTDGIERASNELFEIAALERHLQMLFRTAELKDEAGFAKLLAAATASFTWGGSAAYRMALSEAVLALRSPALTRLADSNRNSPLPPGSWEQDPAVSTPATVDACAKRLKVGSDAARLYLQLLALADPTAANVKRWNGWTSKQYQAAHAELLASEQVLQAKRERAGRDLFLPGGWEPLKLPNLPLETWKLTLFGHTNSDRLRGGYAVRLVCGDSIGHHIETAWQRYESGDQPRYEQATAPKRRSKS